jgi:thioesterase domain-containing protein
MKAKLTAEALKAKLQAEIPLVNYLNFEFIEATHERVHMKAGLAGNTNHKGTAFGGSLYVLAVLSAYSLVYLGVHVEGVDTNNVVIQHGEIEYLAPVVADFEIVCEHVRPEIERKFFSALARWNKVRETFVARIECNGVLCARLTSVFVVKK